MIGRVLHNANRNQNYIASTANRVANRYKPLQSTLKVLQDPKNGRELYLIGSTHASTYLAQRTQNLINQVKPDALFVQTNEKWYDIIKQIKDVESQQELDSYTTFLTSAYDFRYDNNVRGLVFKFRFFTWLAAVSLIKDFPKDFHPFIPGLEMKLAIEEAQKLKVPVHFGGLELDRVTFEALRVETRMDFIPLFWRYLRAQFRMRWRAERGDFNQILNTKSGEAIAEGLDQNRLAWVIQWFKKIAPHQKKIIIDQKDADLFRNIYDLKGKKIFAVVNQWHMEGIEAHWRHSTGTEIHEDFINPLGDMDINAYMESNLINDELRKFTSRLTKSEPATWRNYITQYFKDCQESERFRHVEFYGHDDPHMYHGLPIESDHHDHHESHKKLEGNSSH